jgi:hypothetical protein
MTDQSLQPVFSAIRALLIAAGGYLAAHGFATGGAYTQLAAGSVMVLGPAAWGVWTAFKSYRTTHRLATAVSPGDPKQAIADAKANTL